MLTTNLRPRQVHSADYLYSVRRNGTQVSEPVVKIKIFLPFSSSSTPTVPYSTADILYGNEVNGRERQASVSDEPRQNSFGDAERTKEKRQEKDIEAPSNRRPSSKTGKQRSISIDTGRSVI